MYSLTSPVTSSKVGDTLIAIVDPADAKVTYQWYADATAISGATASTYVVTAADLGKNIKVVVTNENQVQAESEPTADVEQAALTIVDVDQLSANKIAITFASDVDDIVNKDNIKVERVDGLAVIPVNALEWSEDGTAATATLASSLVDKIEYQVSYATGNAVAFTASVGKVSSIAILTATAEQNVTTDVKFALFDENGVDITSTVAVDADCDVAIEGVDGAIVTANTSKPSAATVQMTTVGNKAKVTVTYRPNESLAPATGEIVCTAAQATIGKARFKVATSGWKVWDDGTYCAKFYTGSDDTSVGVSLGAVNAGVFFCAEETDKPGTVISYDSYEVSSSNDDVMTANIEDNLDTGKYCRIAVSGNTVGTANILVKATKNGADYTYTIPVKVVAEKKLTGITVSASRPSMSNAIDDEYYGTLTVTGKYSDGTTSKISDYTSEVADAEKNNKLSNNLLKAMGETQDEATATIARGAKPFTVNGAYYTAGGAQGKTYTINVATTNEDNKEVKAGTTVKVSDLSESAWKLGGDGAAMEYSVELSNGNALDVSSSSKTYTVARLAAYANKLFAGYVRQDETGKVVIGTSSDATDGVDGTYASAYIKAPGETEDKYIQLTSTVEGDTLDAINFTANAKRGSEVTPGEAGEGYKWIETNNALAEGIFIAGKTTSYTKDEDGLYTVNTKKSKKSADEFILVKLPAIEEPTEDQTGIEAVAGEAGDGYEWVATNTAKAGAAGFTAGKTSYKKTSDVYTKNTETSKVAADEYILITPAEIVEEPTSAQLGTVKVAGAAGKGYMWVKTGSDQATAVGFVAGADASYKLKDGVYTLNTAASTTTGDDEYILVSVTLVTTPTNAQLGAADAAAVPGDGNVWVAYDDVKTVAAGITDNTQKYKEGTVTGGTDKYYTIDTTDATQNTMVLVHYAAATPDEDQLGTAEVKAETGDGYSWVETNSAKAINAGFEEGTTTSYTKSGNAYEENTKDSTRSANEYILIKNSTIVAEPTKAQLGTAATAGVDGDGFTWTKTSAEAATDAGFEAGVTPSYTKTDGVYVLNTEPSTASDDEWVLISAASIVTEPSEEQTGSEASEGDETTYSWDAATKTLTIATFEDATTDELIEELSNILEDDEFVVEEVDELPDDVEFDKTAGYTIVAGVDPIYESYGVGQAQPTAKTTISGIYAAVKAGHLYSVNGMIFNSARNVAIEKDDISSTTTYTTSIPVSARAWTLNDMMLVGNTKYDYYFAKPGTYTPTFFFTMDGKDKTASTSVTVKNGFTAPVVTVNQRKLDSLTVDDIRDALTINCDMNNNTSSAKSFNGEVYKNDTSYIIAESESDGDKWTATYIGVDDQGITFIVPINATFYAD